MKTKKNSPKKPRIAVFCSGNGSNLQSLLNYEKNGHLGAEIALVFVNKANAYAIVRANRMKKPVALLESENFGSRKKFDEATHDVLKKMRIQWIVLAGYMRILSDGFVQKYRNRIINIHPSLLPSFKGAHAVRECIESGVKVTGVSVHIVTPDVDDGPIIAQEPVKVLPSDSVESLHQRIHHVEHQLYPRAVQMMISGRYKVKGHKVVLAKKGK